MAESVLRITIDSRQALINAQAVNKELNSIEKNGDFASKSMDSLSVATRTLAGHMAGLVTVGAAVSKMDAYTGLQNRLKLVTNSQVELNKAMSDTFAIAQKTRQSWESAAQVYQGFANNAKALGLTMSQTAQLTETVSKAVAISGGSAASSEAALIQFNQALGAGALRGEELNSVMEQTPGLAKAIAEGMGITVGQLRTVAAQGKITSEELVKALTKAKSSVDDLFSKTDITIGQSITLLNNELSKFVGEAGQSSGAAKTLAESIQVLSQNIDLATNAVMIGGAYWAGTYIPTLYKGIATTISKTSAVFADIKAQQLAVEIDAQRTSRIAHLTSVELANAEVQALRLTGMQRLAYIESTVIPLRAASTAATEADTVAQNANNVSKITASRVGAGLLSVLGGAGGLAGIAVAVGASMLLMSRDTDTATNSLDIQKKTVKELADEYSKMSMNKLISEMDVLSEKSQKAKNEANNALNKARSVAPVVGDFGTEKQREQNKLLNDTIDKLKAGSLDAAKALQELRKGGFSKDQVEDARRAFAAYEDNDNVLRLVNYQMALVNSYLDKSSGLYEKTTDKIADLTKQSNLLSESYSNSKDSVVKAAETLLQIGENSGASAQQLEIARNALNSYGKGAITASQLAQVFQKNLPIPEESINSFIKQSQQSDAYKKSMVNVNAELKKQNDLRDAFQKQHKGILDAKQAETEEDSKQLTIRQKLNKLEETYAQKNLNTDFKLINIKSHGLDMGNALDEFYDANKIPKTRSLTSDEWAVFKKWFDKNQELKKLEDDITESKKKQTKELKEQLKVLQVNEKVKANAAKYNFGGLEGKYGLPSGMLSAIHMIESRGNANAYNKSTGATGGFQFLKGTGDQYGVKDRYNLAQSAEGAAKYLQYLLKLFNGNVEKAVRAYHAGEGNVQKGTNLGKYNNQYIKDYYGYMGGINGFSGETKEYESLLNDQVKMLEKSQDEAEKIRKDFMSKGLQEEKEYKEQLKSIRENSALSGDEKKVFEAQLTARFEAQKKLNDLQQDYELNGYKYTEDQKLIYQRDSAKLQLDAEGKYSDEVKALRKKAYDDQYAYEIEKSKLAKDQRLLQSKEFFMSELQLVQARYDIEQRLLAQSNENPQEKEFKQKMLELQNQFDMDRRLKDASMGWDSVYSQMNGSSGRYQINQDRFSRLNTSQTLFDTQIADVERQEKEPGADLKNLAQVREQIWQAHNQRMIDIENQYQKDSLNLQLTQAQQLTGSFANMFRGILGESSGAYRTMYQMQQGFAITQAGMNLWSSASSAYNAEPGTVWNKMAAAAKATLDQGTFLAMIQSITPQGFATGGHITGKGTGTSDDIPIMASNGEFMMRYAAVQKLGLPMMEYINKTGELPFQREYEALKMQFSMPGKNESVAAFKDGGLVGVSRMSNADVERRQFEAIQRSSPSSQPKVTIINQTSQPVEATSQWDGNELQVVLKEMQKQNEATMDRKISQSWRDAERQGGALDRIKRSK